MLSRLNPRIDYSHCGEGRIMKPRNRRTGDKQHDPCQKHPFQSRRSGMIFEELVNLFSHLYTCFTDDLACRKASQTRACPAFHFLSLCNESTQKSLERTLNAIKRLLFGKKEGRSKANFAELDMRIS